MANLITTGGLIWISSHIQASSTPVTSSYINWGSGSTGVSTTSINLIGETGSRYAASSSINGISVNWIAQITASAAFTASEVGLFTTSVSGNSGMILYGTHAGVPLEIGDSILYSFTLIPS